MMMTNLYMYASMVKGWLGAVSESGLICEALMFARGGRPVLVGLGFCLPPGGFLLLKGANGSGKTTLMRTLAALSVPEEGSVMWEGVPVAKHPDFKRELTYIGHTNALKVEATVEENLTFWARARGTEPMLPAALNYFDLEDKRGVPVGQLSAGWQRRCALARLLLSPGKLWLLDEPTNFLDAEAVALVGSLIETRVKHGGVVVAASHAMTSAFGAHVLRLEDFGV